MRKYFKIFTCGVQDASAYRGNLIVGVLSNFFYNCGYVLYMESYI